MSFFLHAYFPQNLHFYIDICNGHLLKRAQEIRDAVAFGKLDSLKAFAVIFEEIIVGHLLSEDMKFFPCYKVKET